MNCLNIHHVGIWADDIDEMVAFLTAVLGFRLLTRLPSDSGERVFVHLGDNQAFEILSKPAIQSRPKVPAHMASGSGAVVGILHICLRVTDLSAWEEKIRSLNYPINFKWPEQGYHRFELGSARALWFTGPSGVDFELFEFEEEYPIDTLPHV